MRMQDRIMEKFHGKFAICHANILVIPQRGGERKPFDTKAEASGWARQNYRGNDWKVVQIGGRRASPLSSETRAK